MPDCTVTCDICRTDTDTPKVWHWLCEDCATECADRHRRDTGHTVNIRITVEPCIEDLKTSLEAVITHRRRFW